MSRIPRIHEDATVEERPVDVRHHGSDISSGIGAAGRLVFLLKVLDVFLHSIKPPPVVAFIDTIDLSPFRNPDVFVGEQEFSDAGIKREAVGPVSGGVDKHGGGSIDAVPGRDLLVPRLQTVFQFPMTAGCDAAVNGKNGPDSYIGVDVGGSVKRIEQQHVFSSGIVVGDCDNLFRLFGSHHAEMTAMVHGLVNGFMGEDVEFFDIFTVHVLFPGKAQNIHESGFAHFTPDHLEGKRKIPQQS